MNKFLDSVPENQKQIIKSVAPLVIVLILFLIVGKFGFAQISKIRSQIKSAEKSESILTDKLSILRSVAQTSATGANSVLFALPKSNPALQTISQLKVLASQNLVVLSDVKSTAGISSSSDLSSVNVSFVLTGTREQIISFIKGLDTIAPVTFVSKMDLSELAGVNVANVTTKTFYAPLPKTIPTVTQPITDLTPSEKDQLVKILGLTPPVFGEYTVTTISEVNPNPFGQ